MRSFGFLSLLYSLGYFTIRNMLPLLLLEIAGSTSDLSRMALLSSFFNFSYGFFQVFNGALIDKFGFKFIGFTSTMCFFCLFFFKSGFSFLFQAIIIGFLGLFVSAGTLSLTFFTTNVYKSSAVILGFLRLCLIVLGGFFIKGFSLMHLSIGSIKIIFQVIFLLSGFFLLMSSSKKGVQKKIEGPIQTKKIDLQFVFLCVSGIFSAFPYFFLNGGFIKPLCQSNLLETHLANIAYGFGLGNLLIMLSRYINFRIMTVFLCVLQILAIMAILPDFSDYFRWFSPLWLHYAAFFILGMAYVNHLMPVTHITRTYTNPIFMAGLYNFSIMFFSSFGLLWLCSFFTKKYVASIFVQAGNLGSEATMGLQIAAQNTYTLFLLKIILTTCFLNLFFNLFLYVKNRNTKIILPDF